MAGFGFQKFSLMCAVGCRGSWMPGANEVFGCPPTKKLFLRPNSCRKFLTTFFLFLVIFPNFYFFFLNIFPDAPLILDARGRSSLVTHLPLLFQHLPMHFSENSDVGCSPAGCPGPSHSPHPPLCTPLTPIQS